MKNVFSKLAVVAIAATALMSCNNQPKQNDSKAEPATQKEAQAGGQQIAYVEIDSIMSQYTYWKEVTKIMKAKEANISKTLNGKQQQLQQAAANFQQNVQANKYTQAQAQQIQAHHAGGHAAPQLYTGAAAKKHAEHRHQHYIQSGHEPGLGRAGGANAHLLRSRCRKQRDAAADAALYQHLAVLPKARLGGGVCLAGFAQHGHQPQQKHTGQPAAARQKAVRAHVVSAHALRHKSGAPDEGSPHQQQGIA